MRKFSSTSVPSGPSDPGTQGMPAAFMCLMADTLSPIMRMVSARGPTKMNPLFSTRSAKSAFSDKKPYPGWMATASVTSAALMMAGMFRYDSADCGGPMHTVSSASSTCFVLKSVVECTATVLMPSSRHARNMRRAISPRFAMTTFSIIWSLSLFDDEQRLAELDSLAFLRKHRRNTARLVGLDLIHHLHGFNDAKYLADLDF